MFTAYYPFLKFFGVKLNDWEFFSIICLPEKIYEYDDIGHFNIPVSTVKYNWLKTRFVFKKIPIRPVTPVTPVTYQ